MVKCFKMNVKTTKVKQYKLEIKVNTNKIFFEKS